MTGSRSLRPYYPFLSTSLIALIAGLGATPVAAAPPHGALPAAKAAPASGNSGDDQGIMSTLLDTTSQPVARVTVAPPAWYVLFTRATKAAQAGQRADAERLYRKLLETQPRVSAAWANLAILEAQTGRFTAAINDTQKALGCFSNPDEKAALLIQLTQLNARVGQWSDCAASARKAIAATSNKPALNGLANGYLGIALLRLKRYSEAVPVLRKRSMIGGEKAPAADLRLLFALEQTDQFDEAFNVAQQLAVRAPRNADVEEALGDTAVRRRDFITALRAYNNAFLLKPTDIRAGQNAANAALQLGRSDIAVQLLRKMLERNPDNAKLHYALGYVYYSEPASQVQQFKMAEQEFKIAATSDPKNADYIAYLGASIILQQDHLRFDDAAVYFKAALLLNPHESPARLGLGYVSQQKAQFDKDNATGHLDDAMAQYRLIIADAHHDYYEEKARRGLAGILLDIGKKDEGYKEFETLTTLFPNDTASLAELASLYYSDNRYTDAKSAYTRLTTRAPQDPGAFIGLGQTMERLKDPAGAATQYQAALKVDPASATAALAYGNLLKSQQKIDDAIALYETTIKAAPDNPDNNALRLQLGSDYEQEGKIDDAIKIYGSLTLKKGDPNQDIYLLMAPSILIAHGRSAEAEKMLTQMYKEHPKEDDIGYKLASAQEGAGHPAQAEITLKALLNKHLTTPPDTVRPRTTLALLYDREHKNDDAARLFEDTLRIDTQNTQALMGLSRVRTMEKQPQAAGEFLEGLALNGTTPNAGVIESIQRLYLTMDRTPDRYRGFLQKLSDKFPDDRPTQMRRIAYLLDLDGIKNPENRAAAEKLVQAMLQKNAKDADLHYRLGMIREQDGRKDDAVAEYTAAVRQNYGYGPAITALKRLGAAVPTAPVATAPTDKPGVPPAPVPPTSSVTVASSAATASPTTIATTAKKQP